MGKIINPINKKLLQKELNAQTFFRKANRTGNELHIVDAFSAPNVMCEIGRLREIAFRNCGGGTGKSVDIDEYDLMQNPYRQLVVWNPQERSILGGYRFLYGKDAEIDEQGQPKLATSNLFHFSRKFVDDYLPHTIELGRSFVCTEHQATQNDRKSIFILDNLWDGLITLITKDPSMKYFFGKVTMYPNYNRNARNLILYFMKKVFPDTETLLHSRFPVEVESNQFNTNNLFQFYNLKENIKMLQQEVRSCGSNIPPLFSAYMKLTPNLRTLGIAVDYNFGNVEETAILVAESDIFEEKKKRHLEITF